MLPFPAVQLGFAHVWGTQGSSGLALCSAGPQGLTGPALCTHVGPQGFIWVHPLHAGKAVLTQGSFRGGVQRKLFREKLSMFFRIALNA